MSKKQTGEQYAKQVKAERTVKVKTLIKAAIIVVLMGASFVGGWTVRSSDNARVTGEAHALIEQLTSK